MFNTGGTRKGAGCIEGCVGRIEWGGARRAGGPWGVWDRRGTSLGGPEARGVAGGLGCALGLRLMGLIDGGRGACVTRWGVCLAHWVHDWGTGRVSVVAVVAVSPGGRAEAARLPLGFVPRGGQRWDVWAALGHVQRGRSGVGLSGVMAACQHGLGRIWQGRGGLGRTCDVGKNCGGSGVGVGRAGRSLGAGGVS